jgi:hypothetical protein
MVNPREANLAYYQGLQELSPEPEDAARDAEEFGIAYGEGSRDIHIRAGQEVAEILAAHDTSVTGPDIDTGRQRWIDSFHLTGPLQPKSPEERAKTTANIQLLKAEIRPQGDRPE